MIQLKYSDGTNKGIKHFDYKSEARNWVNHSEYSKEMIDNWTEGDVFRIYTEDGNMIEFEIIDEEE